MEVAYGIIRYHPHTQPAAHFANQALAILRDLERNAPQTVPVFLSANSVLTLSGVRAFDAYHYFYDYLTAQDIHAATAVLAKHDIQTLNINAAFTHNKRPFARTFELLHQPAFASLWRQYDLGRAIDLPELAVPQAHTTNDFIAWSYMVEYELHHAMGEGLLPRLWLNDWRAASDLRFGMLLGYPAKALESAVWVTTGLRRMEEQHEATIKHNKAYNAARPAYTYDRILQEDLQIKAHRELWSGILDAVYSSDWHHRLQQSQAFKTARQAAEEQA